jgi:predicted Zn finger-like uncharacterized protein
MIVECPSCDQSYELADEQVMGKSVILSCPPCNTSWIVGPVVSNAGHAGQGHADPTDQMDAMGDDDETGAHYRSPGRNQTSLPPAPSYSAPPSFAPSFSDLNGYRAPMGSTAPSFSGSSFPAPFAAAAPQAAPQVEMDAAESITDERASARRILTGQARERRDLFASRAPSDHGRQTPTPSVPPSSPSMFPGGAGTAARGEHSLLFSVEELKKAATMRPPPPAPTAVFVNGQRMSEDEGGVIDLAPMLSAGGTVKSRTEPLYTPATEMSAMGFALSVAPQKKTPIAVFGAAAAAAVLFLAVGLGVALHGGNKDDQAAASAATANINAVAAAQPLAESPSSATLSPDTKLALGSTNTASPPSSDKAEAVSPVKAQTVSNRGGGKVGGGKATSWKMPASTQKVQSGGTGRFTAKASAPPVPPKAKSSGGGGKKGGADPCGCGGNLQCAMKCGI